MKYGPQFNTVDGLQAICTTYVGYFSKDFPMSNGNCFSIKTKEHQYKILNFGYENLEHLLVQKQIDLITDLDWPIQIHPVSDNHAVIHDDRIPHDYYDKDFCTICTPFELLPLPQQLYRARCVLTGQDVYSEPDENGIQIISSNSSKGRLTQ